MLNDWQIWKVAKRQWTAILEVAATHFKHKAFSCITRKTYHTMSTSDSPLAARFQTLLLPAFILTLNEV